MLTHTRLGLAICSTAARGIQSLSLAASRRSLLQWSAVTSIPVQHSLMTQIRMAGTQSRMARRLEGSEKNVWVEFSKLAVETQAVNLGQGFPDFFPPKYVRDSLSAIATGDNPFLHQYTRSMGHPRLVNALAKTFSPIVNHDIDPMTEVIATVGAYGSLFCAVQGLVNPGEEVIIIEPFFDCYEPMVRVAGGKPVFIPLRPTSNEAVTSADWKLDPNELASLFNSNTKMIIVNNPNNPLGKVFRQDELEVIVDLCKKHDVICVCDDVYEWLVYPGSKLIKIASLPGMWDRTLTVGSAGKTFSATGWKQGWTIGPPDLIQAMQAIHQNCVYTCPTPIQEAVAVGFEYEHPHIGKPECYYHALPAELQPKRERLAAILRDMGMRPTIPEGGYFMLADFTNMKFQPDPNNSEPKDFQFVKWMTKNKRLATIPPSVFYSAEHRHLGENMVRFCFCKEDSTLDKAEQILREWKSSLH